MCVAFWISDRMSNWSGTLRYLATSARSTSVVCEAFEHVFLKSSWYGSRASRHAAQVLNGSRGSKVDSSESQSGGYTTSAGWIKHL